MFEILPPPSLILPRSTPSFKPGDPLITMWSVPLISLCLPNVFLPHVVLSQFFIGANDDITRVDPAALKRYVAGYIARTGH